MWIAAIEQLTQPFNKRLTISKLALPDHSNRPACGQDFILNLQISYTIFRKLICPKINSSFRNISIFTIGVLMPKTAVNKNTNL
ncbi:hypothetical protein BKM04_13350 [Pseudomonas syringae pv. syringae]|nr:hypothetical protein BKM04_13350 [Pseudomonas syringae pv. syringae]POD62581.1 hypothetical protein BKM06_12505 [Pseudomonas syringae pv. syringae]POR67659.1 hypothetical protein BKM27_23040 [Pseudomonas syringae pv. syringae]POR76036.1 hypothetical protein BKM30_19860 [Pseudomonas syringae pv. syringae]